jgi:hypothetical protein
MKWVMTPQHPAFWVKYMNDHRSGKPAYDQDALDLYHRGSVLLANRRVQGDPLCSGRTELSWSGIAKWSNIEPTPENLAIDFLLYIDNFAEPLWMKALVGLPDLIMRWALALVFYPENHLNAVVQPELLVRSLMAVSSETVSISTESIFDHISS